MSAHEPLLHPVPLAELRPTQITVGFREVAQKRKHFRRMSEEAGGTYLGRHMIPAVIGPKGRRYVVDHHHLALALCQDKVESVLVTVLADLSQLSQASFWRFLDNHRWCHPYDASGERVDFEAIPKSIEKLKDDPYRSLAGALRQAGGYAKDLTPFSEFLWADYFRTRIRRSRLEEDFDRALAKALVLAKSAEASFLPGWCGAEA